MPLPPPRKRQAPGAPRISPTETGKIVQSNSSESTSLHALPFWSRVLSWFFPAFYKTNDSKESPLKRPRQPNPFQALKLGKKAIIIAVVDAGTISFVRFGQGAFHEWPMV